MSDNMVLGIDASGSRCGFALVSEGPIGPRLLWHQTIHASKGVNSYESARQTTDALGVALQDIYRLYKPPPYLERYGEVFLGLAFEDPTAFAYATALRNTNRSTNSAAVSGFPWMIALTLTAIRQTWGERYCMSPVYSYQPSQWQSRLGVRDFYAVGAVKEALQRTYSEAHPERNKKDIIRAIVATVFCDGSLVETRLLRSGRYDWAIEQDGVDAAGIAYVGMREHLFGAPAAKTKKKQNQNGKK